MMMENVSSKNNLKEIKIVSTMSYRVYENWNIYKMKN